MAVGYMGTVNTRELRGSKMVRVREFQYLALPSETYFQFRRDQGQPCFTSPKPCAENISARIEAVLANPLVLDVVYSQDTTPGGRLLDIMTVYYQSFDGLIEGAVEIRLVHFNLANTLAAIEAEIASGGDVGEVSGGGGGGGDVVL
jgi:hypothetical protein